MDYAKEFEDKCATCGKWKMHDKSDAGRNGFRCSYHQRQMAHFESCSNYVKDKYRTSREIEGALDWLYSYCNYEPRYDNSYWYIVSTCCKMVGMPEDNKIMNSAIKFREYLDKNHFGKILLLYYEKYGIIFANNLLADKNKTLVEDMIIPTYLEPFSKYVIENNYVQALRIYLKLIMFLSNYYGYPINVINVSEEKLNMSRKRIKVGN